MLELTDGTRERVRELQALSEKAEDGDKDARRELCAWPSARVARRL